MHQLLLLRHAKSSRDDPTLADHARPLNEKGWRGARAIRRAMHDLGLSPDVVLVSSSRRTLQTLEALEPFDDTPMIETLDALYDAGEMQILNVLHAAPETARSVLLIGHNPGLHKLALHLAGVRALAQPTPELRRLAQAYPTATLTEFAVAGPWHALDEGSGQLLRYLAAKDLPEPAA
jgi:phosphohistidine phosphatase